MGGGGGTARVSRAGYAIGPGGPRSPGNHYGRGSRRNPGIRCGPRHRRHLPLVASAIPAEAATPTLYLRGSDGRQDPPNLAEGVQGAHQGGRPGSALLVPVGGEGSLPERLLWFRGHVACLWILVYVHARGSVCQFPARPGLPPWGHVLLDGPLGWGRRGRENLLHVGKYHCLGQRQCQARGIHDCDKENPRGHGGAADDGNRDGDPRLRLAFPVGGGCERWWRTSSLWSTGSTRTGRSGFASWRIRRP